MRSATAFLLVLGIALALAPALAHGGSGRRLTALDQSMHRSTPDITNELTHQVRRNGIVHLLLLENSLATPFFRNIAKGGQGYTLVSVDDSVDSEHNLERVHRVSSMGSLHPEYASQGTLAIVLTVNQTVSGHFIGSRRCCAYCRPGSHGGASASRRTCHMPLVGAPRCRRPAARRPKTCSCQTTRTRRASCTATA